MRAHSKFYARLSGSRRRLTARKLSEQIRATGITYYLYSDEETIKRFAECEMLAYRLDLSFHQTAVLLGEETPDQRPKMPKLLWEVLAYGSQGLPRVIYAAQVLRLTQETNELKQALQDSEEEVKRLRETLDGLEPAHPSRRN